MGIYFKSLEVKNMTKSVLIAIAVVFVIIFIGIIVGLLKNRKVEKSEEDDLTKAVDDVQKILEHQNTKEKPVKKSIMAYNVLVHDDVRNRKLIRELKIKRLISTIEGQLQPMTEEFLRYLFQYDITGFHFYRWMLTDKTNSGGGTVYVDENKLEGFTFLEMIQKGIPLDSIDLIAYGSDAMNALVKYNNVTMDETWWKYDRVCILDPRSMDYPKAIEEIMKDLECIISGDCLLSVLELIHDTPVDTDEIRNIILYRADELQNTNVQTEVLNINRVMDIILREQKKAEEEEAHEEVPEVSGNS